MEKSVKLLMIGLATISPLALIRCTSDGPTPKSADNQTIAQPIEASPKSIPTVPSDDHVLVFIDKSNSIDPNQRLLFTDDQGKEIREILETNGGHLTIYFVHKNLASASYHFERNFAKPDTKDMVEIKARTNLNKFKNSLDSIAYFFNDAINANVSSSNSGETDLWATIRKINEKFKNKSEKARLHVVYLSDMIESVTSSKCGKDYTKKKITTVAMAQEMAEADYPLFQQCFSITKLPRNVSVMMYFPSDSSPNKDYRNIPEYWKALFAKFGVNAVESNID